MGSNREPFPVPFPTSLGPQNGVLSGVPVLGFVLSGGPRDSPLGSESKLTDYLLSQIIDSYFRLLSRFISAQGLLILVLPTRDTLRSVVLYLRLPDT